MVHAFEHAWLERSCPHNRVVRFISRPSGDRSIRLVLRNPRNNKDSRTCRKLDTVRACAGIRGCRDAQSQRSGHVCAAQGRSGSFDTAVGLVRETAEYVVKFCSDMYRVVCSNSIARISALFALSIVLVTALLNTCLTGYLQKNVLPNAIAEVSIVLEREVDVGKIHWISPIGLLGCAPLASIGPVEVGPGPIEKTSVTVPTIRAGLSLAQSILQQKFVLWVNFHNPDVDLVQGSNFSWFGHPVDTTPSSKDFLPGLTKMNSQQAAGTGTSAPDNSFSSETSPYQYGQSAPRQNLCDNSLHDRQCSHYYSSTSGTLSTVPKLRFKKGVSGQKSSDIRRLQIPNSWTVDQSYSVFLRDINERDLVENTLITQGVGGCHLAGSAPRWQFIGPDRSWDRHSPVAKISFAQSMDGGPATDSGSNLPRNESDSKNRATDSSSDLPKSESDSKKRATHRWSHRRRDRRERSHGRQRPSSASKAKTDNRDLVPDFKTEPKDEIETATAVVPYDEQDILKTEQDAAEAEEVHPEKAEAFRQKPDLPDEPLSSSNPAIVSSVEEAPSLLSTEEKKQNAQESKSVNLEVIIPVQDIGNSKITTGILPSHQFTRSGDISGEDVQQWIAAVWRQVTRHVKLPEVAVGKLSIYKGVLFAHMAGEPIPRQLVDVNGCIQLGSGYHTLTADVKAKAHSRLAESLKCTMLTPTAQHHLRFVTPGITGGYDHVFPEDITLERVQENKRLFDDSEVTRILLPTTTEPFATDSSVQTSISESIGGDKGVPKAGPGKFSSLSTSPYQSILWNVDDMGNSVKGSLKKQKIPNSGSPRRLGARQPVQGRPTGGDVHVLVDVSEMLRSDRLPDLDLKVLGKDLHGPLIDRILEIPLDIHDGRANGYIQIRAFDTETWLFPKIDGDIKCRNVDFHFWDCPDHLSKCNFDLIFEDNRLYFHNAVGYFGSVPITVTGDMDLDPETGQYRIVATVPPVEANSIRASLGVRPLPHPVAGAVKGTLHCSGPLEEPIFSGHAEVLRPADEDIEALEDSHAKTAMLGNPSAVAAFDKVAFTGGSAVFTHNTSTDIFTLHDSSALVAGGGKLTGSGQMWVAPIAERDPQAISMRVEGYGIAAKEVMKNYLPETVELPDVLDPGSTNLKATMRGSHDSPVINIQWEAPTMNASGSAELGRTHWKATAVAPTFDVAGTLHTEFPDFQLTKTAYNQSEMNLLTTPTIVGVDTDISMKGCDFMPLVSNTSAVDRVASGQAVRLKINGRAQVSASRKEDGAEASNAAFSGDISLQGLRVNQLNLAKQLGGTLDFSESGFQLLAKGQRSDELLDVKFALPQAMRMDDPALEQDEAPYPFEEDVVAENEISRKQNPGEESVFADKDKGGYFSLRQGKLFISTEVNDLLNKVKIGIRGLKLDDLELASLRGDLQDVSLDLNFDSREGRGELNMSSPRYSGLMGRYLTGGFRWEKDVVRLEKMILQQQRSRYEVEGEYSVPAHLALPKSIPALAQGPPAVPYNPQVMGDSLIGQQPIGRWRIQVTVPNADVEEIIPAARLLSRATSMSQMNYDEAKIAFLNGLVDAGISTGKLGEDLKQLIMPEIDLYKDSSEGVSTAGGLPGLQTLRGKWQGTVQAWGGGEGASTLNIKAKGDSWRWGEYELDKAVAVGSYHSAEGIHLEELSLGTGEAHLLIRGDLLGPRQDATIVLNDFPAALLSPIYRAVPALQNAVPAVTERVSLSPFVDSWERTFKAFGINFGKEDTPMQRLAKGSPVNGLLYVQGALGGSASVPEGVVNVQLYDGALGPTRLSGAKAEFTLNQEQEIQFNLSANPDDSSGFVKVAGTLPFLQESGMRGNMDVNVEVVDGGMMLVSALLPDFRWESGTADIALSASGDITDPEIKGRATIARATMYSPNLKYPLKHVHGAMSIEDGTVSVENFEARAGNHGHIHARGFLPMEMTNPRDSGGIFSVEIEGLELKLNSTYSGRLDSSLLLTKSLKEPVVSGAIELSKGTMQLQFGALASSDGKESGSLTNGHLGAFADGQTLGLGPGVSKVYQPPEVVESPLKGIQLQNLELILGQELRFQVPLMVNLAISGSVEVSGGFDPGTMVPSGTIQIDGGMVNLLATQLRMARGDQPGRITFIPEQGLDPNVDITFTSAAEGFRATCKGRASTWQENLVVADGTDEVRLSQAAKMFQKRLDDVLVAENGQLAFVNLAASTMATMTPRLDTQGQIGAARWRLVSAPNIPDLLTNADRLDLQNIVTNLITGTEVEVQFGPTLQAVVTHKMRGADYGTQWNLSLNLTDKFRLSATVANSPPTTRTIILEYRSEGRPRLL